MRARKMKNWQQLLSNAVTEPQELLELLELDQSLLPAARAAAKLFPLKVPRGFIARMKKGDSNDPLLRQILPLAAEETLVTGYTADPLEEAKFNPLPGLLHKYHGRVLLTYTGACAINCRFCFRRHFAYDDNNPGNQGWDNVVAYINNDSTITEVILSGGDPFIANDGSLQQFLGKLANIAHLQRVRFHTRLPIVLPERITPELIRAITTTRLQVIVVVHCNHPQEIDASVATAIQLLRAAGVALLNQTVLLKNINDNADTLIALCELLFKMGIQPYYLHLLDKVQGTAHFDYDKEIARDIYNEMKRRLSGYLVPKLVCEQPDEPAKTAVFPE